MKTKPLIIICCIFFGFIITVYAVLRMGLYWTGWVALLFTYAAVTAASIYDYRLMLIPNWISLTLFLMRAVLFGIEFIVQAGFPPELPGAAIGCVFSGMILIIASKLSKGGVGAGDIKLFAAIGFAYGLETTLSLLLLSLLSCAVIGSVLVVAKKKTSKDRLPFAPFIWCGFVLNSLLISL